MQRRTVVIVSYYAPSSQSTGARRAGHLAHYLRARGHEVVTIASRASVNGTPADGDIGDTRLTQDLMTSALNWRRDQLSTVMNASSHATYRSSPSRLASVFVPDPQALSWVPFATRELHRIARQRSIDCIITTSPPQSAHLVGLVSKRLGVPWVADFRDGWNFERLAPASPIRIVARLDRSLERRVAKHATELVSVTKPIATDLSRRFNRHVHVITNGFAPEDVSSTPWGPEHDQNIISVVYTGTIEAGARSHLLPALLAGARSAHTRLAGTKKVVLTFAGPRTPEEILQITAHQPVAEHVGLLDRTEVIALQRQASVLVVLIGDDKPGVATGKIFEYLAARRPVLIVGVGNAAAEIVTLTRTGIAVPATSDAICEGLLRLSYGEAFNPSAAAIEEYSWANLTRRYEGVIEAAIRSHAYSEARS